MIDLITVAFNKPVFISHQIRLLRKYLRDDFTLFVVSNAQEECDVRDISSICRNHENLVYIRPGVIGTHWDALNLATEHVRAFGKGDYFGTLDHDVFPIRDCTIIDKIEPNGFYGLPQTRDTRWYLFPGFTFFKRSMVGDTNLDFSPVPANNEIGGLDTGGANYERLYKRLNLADMKPLALRQKSLRSDEKILIPQVDAVEFYNEDFIHSIAASRWMQAAGAEYKEKWVLEYLESL